MQACLWYTIGISIMDMGLNTEEVSTTPARLMAKSIGPRRRLQGVQVPVHVLEQMAEILDAENDAYAAMGGESKKSTSDLVSEALELYVGAWLKKYGAIPEETRERTAFIKRMAEANQRELRQALLGNHEPRACPTCGQSLDHKH